MGEYRNDRSLENTQIYQNTLTYPGDSESNGGRFTTNPSNHQTTVVDTTTFHDAAATENDSEDVTSNAISLLDDIPSIAAFLKRPTLIASETLSVSTTLQPIFLTEETGRIPMATYGIPKSILLKGGKLDKINNFRYFKGVCVLKFMTNANPFTQGRFWISVAPNELTTRKMYKQLHKTWASVTSYPGIELDVQTNTSAILKVPFLAETDAIETNSLTDYANVNVFSLTPIASPNLATSKLSFQVFGWIEDVELIGPTPFNYGVSKFVKAELQAKTPPTETKGPITEVSSVINNLADGISKSPLGAIPFVGTAATAVSWVSGAVNKVASIFGWSRPVYGSRSEPFVQIPGRGYGQVKAEDCATVLALDNENSIGEYESNFQTNIDEMDVEYICSRPAVVSTVQWLQNTVANGLIMALPVGPTVVIDSPFLGARTRRQADGANYRYDMTNFEYLSTLFSHWRADIHFRITFTKTAFHTGRVEVAFIPGHLTESELASLSTNVDLTNTYRQIIDITNQNEFNITIPYVSPYPMCRTSIDNTLENVLHDSTTPIGILIVRQLTPLIMPETVSPFVTVQAWKWASNVTFAGPLDQGFRDATTVAPPKPPTVVKAELEVGIQTDAAPITQVVWGKQNPENLKAPLAVCGERMHNVRALTRAHRGMNTNINTNSMLNCNVGANLGGYIGRISNLFAFYRGGISFKFMPDTLDDVKTTGSIRTKLFTTYNGTNSKALVPMEHTTYLTLNPIHEVMVPYYATTRRSVCNTSLAETPVSASTRSVCMHVTSTTSPLRGVVAAKDDFTMSYLIGVATQIIPNTL